MVCLAKILQERKQVVSSLMRSLVKILVQASKICMVQQDRQSPCRASLMDAVEIDQKRRSKHDVSLEQ